MCIHYSAYGVRLKIDRRRLEAAHFKYAMLCVALWYPDCVPVFSSNMDIILPEFTSAYQQAFHKKYSGEFEFVEDLGHCETVPLCFRTPLHFQRLWYCAST